MEFEWDEAKNSSNRTKHEVDFALVHSFDWESAIVEPDKRFDYGEDRLLARGYAHGLGYSIVFTFRGQVVRIISIRQFNRKEERRYGRRPE